MASIRNIGAERGGSDRLLDAARESILSVGWRRTTLTDVARRAGVSRMTVYRAYPDMPALLGDLMTREWTDVVTTVDTAVGTTGPAPADAPRLIAARLVATVGALRENELFRRILDVDPELLLPYLLDRRGRSQDAVLDLLATRIAAARPGEGVRAGDPRHLARTIVLAAHGFLLSARTMADDGLSVAALDEQLGELVAGYLSPGAMP